MGKKKAKPLKVRCSFEPDRLAMSYLKEAYEQLVPTTIYTIVNSDVESIEKPLKSSSSKERAT
jgi:hypothetical protein